MCSPEREEGSRKSREENDGLGWRMAKQKPEGALRYENEWENRAPTAGYQRKRANKRSEDGGNKQSCDRTLFGNGEEN